MFLLSFTYLFEKAKMSDVGEVRASNMELIDQLTKAKAAIEKLTEIKEKQRAQIDVSGQF